MEAFEQIVIAVKNFIDNFGPRFGGEAVPIKVIALLVLACGPDRRGHGGHRGDTQEPERALLRPPDRGAEGRPAARGRARRHDAGIVTPCPVFAHGVFTTGGFLHRPRQ